ncbi:MAG TPA: hypothetical protein VG759_29350 [Candidatus Angelobacter sp.]|jgi:hypothetical protein|nr:hypothetical protein [Candidatus Angelobacter sp.]
MNLMSRVIIIGGILGAMLWFGLSYGPAPSVRADIYMDLVSSYRSIPDLDDPRINQRTGVTLLNLNRLYYRVSGSKKPVHDVLDEYQETLTPKQFHLFSSERLPGLSNIAKVAPEVPFLEFLMNQKRIVREESPHWGMISFLDMGAEANRDWHVEFRKKTEAFAKSNRLGDLGVAKTVVAVPNAAGDFTTVIAYWTDPDFNLRNLRDDGVGDLPGKDIEGFPRIRPSRRLVTFEQVEDRLGFIFVVYETSLSPQQALTVYQQESERQGWTSKLRERPQGTGGTTLFLDRGRDEAQLFARRDGSRTLVLVNHRTIH